MSESIEILDKVFFPVRDMNELASIHGDWIRGKQNSLKWPTEYPCLTRGESDELRYYAVEYLYRDDAIRIRDSLSHVIGDSDVNQDMLAALEAVLWEDSGLACIEQVRDAIRKAKGEA